MTIVDKLWVKLCALVLIAGASWCVGYYSADQAWTQRDTKRKLTDAEEAGRLSEEYRVKEKKLNEHIGYLETKGINDSAAAEMELKSTLDRMRDVASHPTDGLRVKRILTCDVSDNTGTSTNSDAKIQTGLSTEIAGDIIRIGTDCDQAIISLQACQDYVESIRK